MIMWHIWNFIYNSYPFYILSGLLIAIVVYLGWRKSTKLWHRDTARIVGIIAACSMGAIILFTLVLMLMGGPGG